MRGKSFKQKNNNEYWYIVCKELKSKPEDFYLCKQWQKIFWNWLESKRDVSSKM